jgi:hypothetical protein
MERRGRNTRWMRAGRMLSGEKIQSDGKIYRTIPAFQPRINDPVGLF